MLKTLNELILLLHVTLQVRMEHNCFYSLLSCSDVTGLLKTQPVPQAAAYAEKKSSSASASTVNSVAVVVFAFVAILTLLLAVVSVVYGVKRPRRNGATDTEGGTVSE